MKKILFSATVQGHIRAFHMPYLEYWHNKGYEVHVASKIERDKCQDVMEQYPYVIWHQIDFARSPFSKKTLIAYKQLKVLMSQHQYELVHVHTPVASILGRLAAKKVNIPNIVYTAHGFHFYHGAPILNWLTYYPVEKLMARYTDALITMNEQDYQLAKAKFKTRKPNSIYKVNGVGIDISKYSVSDQINLEFKKSLGLKNTDFIITIIAELSNRKNHKQIIEAMKKVKEQNSDIKVLFVGEGPLESKIKAKLVEYQLEETIYLLGYINDIKNILSITDCCALFALQEGLPRNIMEAMVAGKPVIATNIRGNQDLVVDGQTGYLVEIGDIEATVNAIKKLKGEPNNFGENAKKRIEAYRIEEVLKPINKIYTELL